MKVVPIREPARDVVQPIGVDGSGTTGTIAIIAWGLYWCGLIWAAATGRLG